MIFFFAIVLITEYDTDIHDVSQAYAALSGHLCQAGQRCQCHEDHRDSSSGGLFACSVSFLCSCIHEPHRTLQKKEVYVHDYPTNMSEHSKSGMLSKYYQWKWVLVAYIAGIFIIFFCEDA
jgi:hypothetical protein